MHPPECCLKKGSQLFYIKPLRSQLWLQCLNKAFHIQALEQHSVRSSRQDWPTSPTPRPHTFTSLPVSIPFSQYTHALTHKNTHIYRKGQGYLCTQQKRSSQSRDVMLVFNRLCLHIFTHLLGVLSVLSWQFGVGNLAASRPPACCLELFFKQILSFSIF